MSFLLKIRINGYDLVYGNCFLEGDVFGEGNGSGLGYGFGDVNGYGCDDG